jgi:hypothetical protein
LPRLPGESEDRLKDGRRDHSIRKNRRTSSANN